MSVQGFKGLIKTTLFTDDSFQPLLKKSDQYRKITEIALHHFQSIVRNFETFQKNYERMIVEYQQDIQLNQISVPQYYQKYIQLYRNIWSEQKSFSDKLINNFRELTSLCDSLFSNFSNTIFNFQNGIRNYKGHEQVLIQLSKKYFRTHKNMVGNIELYKQSFTDVKIIYNMDQKNKRYNVCQGNLKNLQEELETIEEKVGQLSTEKEQIIESYKDIQKQFILTLKAAGSKLIAISRSFIFDFCQMEKIIITYLAQKKFTLQKIQLKTFFTSQSKLNFADYFNVQIDPSKLQYYPIFIVYQKNIKEEYYSHLGKMFTSIAKQNDQKIQNRKKLNKKVLEFTSNFIKTYEKANYLGLKEIILNFQKVKKKLSQIFGSKLCSFLKSIHSIFDLSVGINEKLLKRILGKLKSIEQHVAQQIQILDLFQKEFRFNIQKFLKKKQLKRLLSTDKQMNEFTQQQPSLIQIDALKSQITQKSQYLAILIDGFVQKLKKNYDQLKFHYNAIINDISVSTNQFYSLCCEYQQLYFGQEEFLKNYKKYEVDIDATLLNQCKFFQQLDFGSLLKDDHGKIIFQPELGKIQEFKKLKRPIQIQVQQKKQPTKESVQNSDTKRKQSIQSEPGSLEGQKKNQDIKGDKNQITDKYLEFLASKIVFLPQQKFFKSFSCALSDKILLSGRLYITNKRVCFHSKFNPSNVFFGDTFIQIPKKDVKKVQKRFNAIVFDNSISLTTVNGQVFFTSFFSRNQAFDLICEAFQIDTDECMFEPDEIKDEIIPEQITYLPQQDDIKQNLIAERSENITKLLSNFPYKQVLKTQFAYPNFNAFKYLKIFQIGGEMIFNRKKYKNFAVYMKQILEHKQYQFGQWSPSLVEEFMNPTNIKNTTPISFTRKISCFVPIANSGVPFMPKQAKSEQSQTLYIISKDKFILQSSIQNSGVPYSDSFNLKIQKVVQTLNENCCRLTISLFANFVSSTIMKGVIESKSTEETKVAVTKAENQAKKYLNFLERTKLREGKKQTDPQVKNVNNNEEYQKQIAQLRQNEQKLNQEVKIGTIRLQQGKKFLIGSLVLNVLLILILLT